MSVFGGTQGGKTGILAPFNHSGEPRVVPIRNFQTVSKSEVCLGLAHQAELVFSHYLLSSPLQPGPLLR